MCDIKRAFEKLCESPVESQTFYVSLYARVPLLRWSRGGRLVGRGLASGVLPASEQ
jgi:hypothetical protein